MHLRLMRVAHQRELLRAIRNTARLHACSCGIGNHPIEDYFSTADYSPMQKVGSVCCFPVGNGRVGPSGLTVEDWALEMQNRKPLKVQWPAVHARISLIWRAPACLPKGHGMDLLDVIE
jgi:hypothetical protein